MPSVLQFTSYAAICFCALTGALFGDAMSEDMGSYLIGNGASLRLSFSKISFYHHVRLAVSFFLATSLTIIARTQSLPLLDVNCIYGAILFTCLGALYVTDLRSRTLPEIWTAPIVFFGLWIHINENLYDLSNCVAAGLVILGMRYLFGLLWNIYIVAFNPAGERLEFYLAAGDITLILACSVWVGLDRLQYFLLSMAALCIVSYFLKWIVPSVFRVAFNHSKTPDADSPVLFPFGVIIIASFLFYLTLTPFYN